MGVQIIKRKPGQASEKITVDNKNMKIQVSYNSSGHIAIRYINLHDEENDILVVLDADTSFLLKDFIKYRLQ